MRSFAAFVLVPIFLLALASQNIFEAREDFPLSRWGMYKHLKWPDNYQKLKIEITHNGKAYDFYKISGIDPYTLRDQFRQIYLGMDRRHYIQEGKKHFRDRSQDENLKIVLRDHVIPALESTDHLNDSTQITISLLHWKKLSSSKFKTPDSSTLLFEGGILESAR